ncbi:unnamed protein product [Wuchereria bancrofti]|uniref:Uncharacterized protein n=2 Tax=Wuchereria bancrofti TaxID=6293 RepID=A0A3P7FA08_WUCBA|nr:unnamed protein product [Wuchereria bancrofti]
MFNMSEENFGVPGFSLVEGLGPEATEEIHEAVTLHPSTVQSPNVESKVCTFHHFLLVIGSVN